MKKRKAPCELCDKEETENTYHTYHNGKWLYDQCLQDKLEIPEHALPSKE